MKTDYAKALRARARAALLATEERLAARRGEYLDRRNAAALHRYAEARRRWSGDAPNYFPDNVRRYPPPPKMP